MTDARRAPGPDHTPQETPIEPLRITVYGENRHETTDPIVQRVYPEGMHTVIAEGIEQALHGLGREAQVRIALLDDIEDSLSEEVLARTDVLTWWGHMAHDDVPDQVVDRVVRHVRAGMGFLPLHSAHYSRPFKALMGTECDLLWRNDGEEERVWTVDPSHPITRGVPQPILIPEQEAYIEWFAIPAPDELIFVSSFAGGEIFRSGCGFRRGKGKIFYFSPGDQEYPVYRHQAIRRVLANAALWAAPEPRERTLNRLSHVDRDWYRDPEVARRAV
ncbi:ThuA domain-containing protein [Brachybacterium sp. AOP25-B2-12]|uniref:ThuA domain-containing protein n=1 Tax=Brachybacterium sp. AOP25-B2-12 TaxID=3457710 RepID=UPI0040341DC2